MNNKIRKATKINAIKLFLMEEGIRVLREETERKSITIKEPFPRDILYRTFKKNKRGLHNLLSKSGKPNSTFKNAEELNVDLYLEEFNIMPIKEDMKEGFKKFIEEYYWIFHNYHTGERISQYETSKKLYEIVSDTLDAI